MNGTVNTMNIVADGTEGAEAAAPGTTRYFVDEDGGLIGLYGDRATPPEGAIEVMAVPPHGDAIWQGGDWAMPVPVPPSITFAQLLIKLVREAWITEAEGLAWLGGVLPPGVLALIATLPQAERFAATARALRPSEVLRADPLVNIMAAAIGKAGELDDFFRTYNAA